jgi:hypothetical protein
MLLSLLRLLLLLLLLLLLQRSTCADKDIYKRGQQPQRCHPGWEFDPSKANVSPPSKRRCCKVQL